MEVKNIEERIKIALSKDFNEKREMMLEIFEDFLVALELGQIRVVEKRGNIWHVNTWVKKGILLGFKLGENTKFAGISSFIDKDTYPLRDFTIEDNVRIVPPASGIRRGSFVAKRVTLMPPAYINVGAFVDEETMVEGLVGSCAQIGKRVHLSAGTVIGGVLDPIEASPVIIENDVLLGENAGITQGVRVEELATIAPGVHISGSTPIFDSVNNLVYTKSGTYKLEREKYNGIEIFKQGKLVSEKDSSFGPIVPKGALVINGISLSKNGYLKSSPTIVKYIKTIKERSFSLEEALR